MPAEQGLGLEDQQHSVPCLVAADKLHEHRAVGRGAAGALDAPPEDEEPLAQQGLLGDQLGPAAHEIGDGAHHDALPGGLRRGEQALPERADKGLSEKGAMAEQALEHG